jgi:hypothetical protein
MDAINLMKEEDALLTETVESGCNRVGFATVCGRGLIPIKSGHCVNCHLTNSLPFEGPQRNIRDLQVVSR